MSTVRNSVPGVKPTLSEAVDALREHLDAAEAETLARRYLAADDIKGKPLDTVVLKQRLLKRKPAP